MQLGRGFSPCPFAFAPRSSQNDIGERSHHRRSRNHSARRNRGELRPSPGIFSSPPSSPNASRAASTQTSLAGQRAHRGVYRHIDPVLYHHQNVPAFRLPPPPPVLSIH